MSLCKIKMVDGRTSNLGIFEKKSVLKATDENKWFQVVISHFNFKQNWSRYGEEKARRTRPIRQKSITFLCKRAYIYILFILGITISFHSFIYLFPRQRENELCVKRKEQDINNAWNTNSPRYKKSRERRRESVFHGSFLNNSTVLAMTDLR